MLKKKKIGILGYGNTGQFLSRKILNDTNLVQQFELIFIWNRSEIKHLEIDIPFLSGDLATHLNTTLFNQVDLIVEVCHPAVIHQHGVALLSKANLFVASVTAMANHQTENMLKACLNQPNHKHSIFLPAGAAWGIHDIKKMAQLNTLDNLHITMQFNADALKLKGHLTQILINYKNDEQQIEPLVLYEGNVRELAALAPNNVNTMTCLALAANTIGLDKTQGKLIAQKNSDAHLVLIEVQGKNGFYVKTERYNPAKKGAVTGDETYHSFLASLQNASAKQQGIHFC